MADDCGLDFPPEDSAPFLSTVGLPIVNGADGIIAGDWKLPIAFDEEGAPSTNQWGWHGTRHDGTASSNHCDNWMDGTDGHRATGMLGGGQEIWSDNSAHDCDQSLGLTCIQVNNTFFAASDLHVTEGKRAFVTEGEFTGDMTFNAINDVAAADALCVEEATTSGLPNAASFVAYVSADGNDALCRVLGETGTVATDCGTGSLPMERLWVRTDGYPIGTINELLLTDGARLHSPIATTAAGVMHPGSKPGANGASVFVWTGTDRAGAGQQNCSDWTTTTTTGRSGNMKAIGGNWPWYATPNCTNEYSVYCLER